MVCDWLPDFSLLDTQLGLSGCVAGTCPFWQVYAQLILVGCPPDLADSQVCSKLGLAYRKWRQQARWGLCSALGLLLLTVFGPASAALQWGLTGRQSGLISLGRSFLDSVSCFCGCPRILTGHRFCQTWRVTCRMTRSCYLATDSQKAKEAASKYIRPQVVNYRLC